jgi:signal transduction histidine kinase
MKEVSCRFLEMFFRELRKKGLPPEALIEGVGYPLRHFQNKHERIDWSAFVRMMENAERIWTQDEIEAMAGASIDSPFLRHTRIIARVLFTPKRFYQWLASDETTGRGGANEMFSCVRLAIRDLGPDRLMVDLVLDQGCAQCPTFFLLTKGGLRDIPRLVGKPRATVDMQPLERGARYDVRLPPGSDRVNPVRRAVKWLTSPAAAAEELDKAHEELRTRCQELEKARARVALQAAQLQTAHTVNALVQKNFDLGLTLEAIANALVNEAGFLSARVDVDVEIDGVKIARSVQRGEGAHDVLERVLVARGGHTTGKLTVGTRPGSVLSEREELLSFIVPSISMAVDNAVNYLVVEEYRCKLELRVAERTAELSQARDKLAETVEHLEKAKEVRERIFADLNHDLRSPLTLVLLAVEEARRSTGLSDDGTRALDAIEHGARRVLRMVDELLILAEGREGEVRLWTAPCDLGPIVRRATDVWRPAARIAGLTLDVQAEDRIVVRADRHALDRVLANILSNAVKFTPAGGTVTVRMFAEGDHAVLEVEDNGPGIDEELRPRLFRRFERGKGAKNKYVGGSGLGLSLVRELVEAHGGSVSVRDADTSGKRPRGAIFRVELPRASARTSTAPPPRASSRPPPALGPRDYGVPDLRSDLPIVYDPPGTPRATLLLAENDPELRDRTAKLLAEEYRVYAAPDGLCALAMAQQHSPDLLLTDVAMPGIDGIELTRRFRALTNNRLAPVLVLTTFGGVRDKLTGFDAGAVDYIHKPFEPDELRARVRSQLMLRSLALKLLETEKLAALGTLSAGLAHELRNPANGIINAVGPLKELLPPECVPPGSPAAQLLDVIEHCSKQVAAMSRQLLGFKRDVAPNRQPVPIETLISRVCMTVSPSLEGVELRKNLGYRGVVHCAEPLMAQVLTNLVQNGAHAAGRGGWVEVRTGLEEQRVFVEVRDSGPGVPEELRERIFEPFFTTKPAGRGTGLGLSTARDIVLRHGGSLAVRSASGPTVFRVELPLPS